MYEIESFNTYQKLAKETAIYPPDHEIWYLTLGLAGEAGEVANKIKKQIRDGAENRKDVIEELGDVLWYIALLARALDMDLSTIATMNIDKLKARFKEKLQEKANKAKLVYEANRTMPVNSKAPVEF